MLPTVAFAFVAGVLTILAPCTLPVAPLILGAGSAGSVRRPLGIVLGFGASFVLAAVLLASVLETVGLTSQLRVGSALVLGAVGASLALPAVGRRLERQLAPLSRLAPMTTSRSGGLLAGVAIGAAIGLLWAPCVGPLMATVLAVAATSGPTAQAVLIAVAYVAGAALPLLAIAALGRRAIAAAGRPERRARVQRAFGTLMVVASLVIATGYDTRVETAIASVVPGGSAGLPAPTDPASPTRSIPAVVLGGLPAPIAADLPASVALDDLGPAPEVTGITAWINSNPLTLASLRGKVVLVHFWTFACINCLHAQPYVKAWYDRYAAAGLVVLGIHTPELSFERDLANVRSAVASDEVTFPVAFDPAYATWNAYGNGAWPAFYFIDKAGRIRHVHGGEGDYAASEQVIRELLATPG
jgi:cytochrome c biogenesis protein CcdA/thiol-disulfide isomerase/thioredoxin